jgi:GT2 family glycosyltransferase
MNNPKISIVIPTWNGQHFLENCLLSLSRQTFKNFEIIIIDNGSEDNTIKFLKENYPEIKLVALEKNLGFCSAINKGIKEARGAYIFLLNNDTEMEKDCLSVLNDVLDQNKEVYFCAAKMLFYDNREIINDAGDIFSIYGIAHQRGKGEVDSGQYNKNEFIFGACAGAAIYRKELFLKVGLFDEDFFAYLEDIDFSFRAQLQGYKCLYVPQAIVYHIDGGTSKKINNFSRFYTLRNSLFVITKNFPLSLILCYLPFLLLGQIRNLFVGIKHRSLKTIFNVYKDYFLKLPIFLKKRKNNLKNRKVPILYLKKILSKEYPFSIKNLFWK